MRRIGFESPVDASKGKHTKPKEKRAKTTRHVVRRARAVTERPRLLALDEAPTRHVSQLLRQGHLHERRLARNTLQARSSTHIAQPITRSNPPF